MIVNDRRKWLLKSSYTTLPAGTSKTPVTTAQILDSTKQVVLYHTVNSQEVIKQDSAILTKLVGLTWISYCKHSIALITIYHILLLVIPSKYKLLYWLTYASYTTLTTTKTNTLISKASHFLPEEYVGVYQINV